MVTKNGLGLVSKSLVLQEQLKEPQKVLDGKKASLRKTYKTQTVANNSVWVLSENTEKPMSQCTKIHEKYEDVGKKLVDVDHEVEEKAELIAHKMGMFKQAAREADDATKRLRMARERHRNVAKVYDKVEEEVNETLGELKMACVRQRRQCSLSKGTGDRTKT